MSTDLASIRLAAIARNDAIVAEGRDCFGLELTREQAVCRVMEARWPSLTEREAQLAAMYLYEIPTEA